MGFSGMRGQNDRRLGRCFGGAGGGGGRGGSGGGGGGGGGGRARACESKDDNDGRARGLAADSVLIAELQLPREGERCRGCPETGATVELVVVRVGCTLGDDCSCLRALLSLEVWEHEVDTIWEAVTCPM